jgi:uncharacterized caspase-like protein
MLNGSDALTRFLLACIVLAATLGYPSLAASAEQRIALVIGNSAYPAAARLRNPVNDAKAMADKLRALGFDVTLRTDASQRDMTRAISQFGQKLTPGSVSLFYYAGHGMQMRGKNFLIPIDAEIETEGSVHSEAVDVDQLLNQLGPARLSMVILDACRNNPFERRFRSTGTGGLAQIDAPTGTLLAYATAPGKVASDGSGSNGLYTEALLKALDMPGLKVEDVFKQVRINVLKASDNLQIPWESSSLTGEFFFRSPVKSAAENEELQQAAKERAELQKAFEDERRKREQEAQVLMQEMQKLRAELLKMRDTPAQVQPPAQAAGPASAAPAVAAAKPAGPAVEQRPQVALAAPTISAPPATPSAATADWAPRIALLEKLRGQLTLSKAVAILLDINSAHDLSVLLTHEADVKQRRWQTAHALGADKHGNLIWAGSWNWRRAEYATETALEHCAKVAGDFCKVVVANGDFREQEFLDVAKRLAEQNVAAVRREYLEGLRKNPARFLVMQGSQGTPPTFGVASIRE